MRLLTEVGPLLGFSVTIISEVTVEERDVNSTRIRDLLGEGHVEEAARLLGRDFSIRGQVVKGMQRGRGLGFPTANLAPENEVVPAPGVYVCRLRFVDGSEAKAETALRAVTNVGYRPTFDDRPDLVPEAHLIDFSEDIYGREVELSFLTRLRPEQKFSGPDALRAQIERDVESARAWFASAADGSTEGPS